MQKFLKRLVSIPGIRPIAEGVAFFGWACTATYLFHQDTRLVLIGVGLYLFGNIGRIIVDLTNAKIRVELKDKAVQELLKFFVMSVFGSDGSKSCRASVLLPTPEGEYLYPRFRYEYGAAPGNLESTARFKKGSALAGFAWADPGVAFTRDMGPFASESEFRAYYRSELRMSEDEVALLSSHLRSVRSVFCVALVDHRHVFLGVLSIDCTRPRAFEQLKKKRIEEIRLALAAILEEV
jgi:hypothetical protein